jgi:putative oxidoreductase
MEAAMSDTTGNSRLYVPAMGGIYDSLGRYAWPLIRVATGLMIVPHGMQKLFGVWGGNLDFYVTFFKKVGLEPALPLVYLVGITEFVGGICLAIGFLTRIWAAGLFINLTVAWYVVHLGNGMFWTRGGIEFPLLWSILCLAFFLRGGGEYSVDSKLAKEF